MAEAAVERTLLDTLLLPSPSVFERIEVRRISIPPGVAVGAHVHNGPVFGVIEWGSAHVQVGDGPDVVMGPGQTFSEPAAEVITRFDATDEGVVFLAWFPTARDIEPLLTVL